MMDYIGYLIAQTRVAARTREALPNSPVVPDQGPGPVRHRISVALHRLANHLELTPDCSHMLASE